MRELRFVMSGEDGHLVVETSGTVGFERFRLPVTDALRDAVAPAVADSDLSADPSADPSADEAPVRRPKPTPEPPAEAATEEPAAVTDTDLAISPRDIQMRVRSGEIPEEIAETFNASLDWVMRFAGPVIEERGRLTDEARRARARRSTADAQTVYFGETVDARFAAHGIDPALVLWDSHRREDGQWVITAYWVGGESERTAEWAFNLTSRTVTAIDETASDLLSDRPIRPVFTDAPVTLNSGPPLAPGVVAFPARPNAHTGPLPTRQQLYDQHAFREDPVKAAAAQPAEKPAVVQPVAVVAQPDFGAQQLPLTLETTVGIDDELLEMDDVDGVDGVDDPDTERLPQVTNLGIAHRELPPKTRIETEEDKAARAHIPSWDDILLGVRRKND